MAWGCQRKEKRRSGSMRSMVISNGTRSCCFCSLATSASTAVPTIFPEMRAPGLNGASNFTPNQAPNSLKSHKARQTRLRGARRRIRSEEHTSELQSHSDLVCRLLLEKKKTEKDVQEQST